MAVALVVLVFAFLLTPVVQTEPPGFVRWSAAELARRDDGLATRVGPDDSARETLADYGIPDRSHRFRLLRRDGDGAPEQHEHIEDVVFVQSGNATLQVGGDMVSPVGSNGEYRGDAITGGIEYPVGPGTILHIPANTPHRYLVPEGGHVTYMLVRFPAFTGEPVLRADAPTLSFNPAGFALWSAPELTRRRNALATDMRPDHSSRETLADYGHPDGGHRFRHIHRDADGAPEIHDKIIDVVFVTSGEGYVQVGGEMLGRTGSLGTGIAGGVRHPVGAGDILHIPVSTPHGYLVPPGGHITHVLARLPRVVVANTPSSR